MNKSILSSKVCKKSMILANFIFVLTLFLALIPGAAALVTYTDLYLTVKDANTNEIINSVPVDIELVNVNLGTTINLTKRTDKDGILTHRLSVGTWKVTLKPDTFDSPEIDYLGDQTFIIEENTPSSNHEFYVAPAGAVDIFVVDESGDRLSGVELTVKCKSYKSEGITDRFGSLKIGVVPAGECKVQGADDSSVGSSEIVILKGELVPVELVLDQKVITKQTFMYVFVGIVVAFISLLSVHFGRKKYKEKIEKEKRKVRREVHAKTAQKKKKGERKQKKLSTRSEEKQEQVAKEEVSEEGELNPRARDIMKTLSEREIKIVDFLLDKEGKGTQATIRTGTSIPKTSLARLFQTLENKKVIEVEKIGKLKKVNLTNWFLGKE